MIGAILRAVINSVSFHSVAGRFSPSGNSPTEFARALGMLKAATKSWMPLYWESLPHMAKPST